MRARLKRRGIELMAPRRRNCKQPKSQDGRKLRRYRRRWKVERPFTCFGNFRGLIARWERHRSLYLAGFHRTGLMIALNRL